MENFLFHTLLKNLVTSSERIVFNKYNEGDTIYVGGDRSEGFQSKVIS